MTYTHCLLPVCFRAMHSHTQRRAKLVFGILSNVYSFMLPLHVSKLNAAGCGEFQAQLYPVQNCHSLVNLNVAVGALNIFILII
jgi:hypothetical protein